MLILFSAKEEENTLLDDLSFQMEGWAKELLEYYYEKVTDEDLADVSPERRDELEELKWSAKMDHVWTFVSSASAP